ncbi:MAG: hypothetical protein ACREPV_13275 [Lysobacter sp.]
MDVNRRNPRRAVATAVLLSGCLVAGAGVAADPAAASCGCSTIKVKKFYDANANGVHDPGEPGVRGWKMTLESISKSVNSSKNTNVYGVAGWGIKAGSDYSLREGTPDQTNWVQSAPVDANGDPVNPQTGIVAVPGKTAWVKFGNYCTVGSGGRTPGYWGNKNGERRMGDGGTLQPELDLLGAMNLVDANGLAFDPSSHAGFKSWLRGSNAVNMAYKLSSHLAAMALNVEAGYVDGDATFVSFGGTVNELMALANQSLADHPKTFTGHPERAYQEQLKNYLDALNNNAAIVSPIPCKRSFSY